MTAIVSTHRNLIYHRDYHNDWQPQLKNQWQRIAMVAIPFLSLNKSLRYPISLALGSLRVLNSDASFSSCEKMVHAALAVAALQATTLCHPIGMIMTTAQDILLEIGRLKQALEGKQWNQACMNLTRILNHAFHLILISRGGLELSMISLTLHLLVHLISSREEFKKGHWLEGGAELLMGAIRLNQLHSQYKQLIRNREIERIIKRITVGELHEKWQFPSDHLPVGVEVNGVRIISWNVLNNAYMRWVTETDSQGLNGSMISELNLPVNGDGLTKRDVFIADLIRSMTDSGHIIALQECSIPFLEALEQRLPHHWQVVRSFDAPVKDQDVILYDASSLVHHVDSVNCQAYPSVPNRPLQHALFSEEGGSMFSLFNAHIPGDPNIPAREEFAEYVYQQHQDSITIALGDNNFERHEMIEAFQKVGFDDFSLHSPWKTNVDPYGKFSKAIDHIFIAGDHSSRDLHPDEVMPNGNLRETIDLL